MSMLEVPSVATCALTNNAPRMIVDAPLQLPSTCRYAILGSTSICHRLQEILAVVRPKSQFVGLTEDPQNRAADLLIVPDLAVEGAAALLTERDHKNVAIMPVPIGDPWSYWRFSDFALDSLIVDSQIRMTEKDLVEVQKKMGRIFEHPDTGEDALVETFYLSSQKDLIGGSRDEVFSVIQGFADDESRDRYSILLMGDPSNHWSRYLARVYANIQYFDYLDYSRCQVVINGGVFGGYELPFFVTHLPKGATVHNIDPLGHDPLAEYVRPWVESGEVNFLEHRIALSDKVGEIEIAIADDGQVSTINNVRTGRNRSVFPCTKMDDMVKEANLDRVDLIKLDLEGADYSALIGAVHTLANFRPQVALSIYHYFTDFWDIPRFVQEVCPDYNFYLDFYSFERWETILYGVPKELGNVPTSTAMPLD